jgi:hypothetical protein
MKMSPRKQAPPKRRPTRKARKSRSSRHVKFPQARGRIVEMVELFTDPDYPCISIRFQDSNDLTVVIDPALTFSATYSEWKKGNGRVLKRWPEWSAARISEIENMPSLTSPVSSWAVCLLLH